MSTKIAVAGVLAIGAAVACSATAAADPPPPIPADPPPPIPADPAAPVPPPDPTAPPPSALGTMNSILGQAAQPAGPSSPPDFLLSQNPVPAVGGGQPAGLPMNAMDSMGYLNPLNYRLSPPDQENPYSMAPGDGSTGTISGLKGAHSLWHGVMGKMDPSQLGEPLPGTAPPPGTNMPQGLGENLPDQQPPGSTPVPPPAGPAPAPPPAG